MSDCHYPHCSLTGPCWRVENCKAERVSVSDRCDDVSEPTASGVFRCELKPGHGGDHYSDGTGIHASWPRVSVSDLTPEDGEA